MPKHFVVFVSPNHVDVKSAQEAKEEDNVQIGFESPEDGDRWGLHNEQGLLLLGELGEFAQHPSDHRFQLTVIDFKNEGTVADALANMRRLTQRKIQKALGLTD